MAIFHLSMKAIGRSAGRSATAAAAYRAGERVHDERTGLVHDYSRKGGVVHREIVIPPDAPSWARDRAQLWNAAELAETRKNSTVAREIEVALPTELPPDAQRALARTLADELTARHCCAVDLVVHAPARGGDHRNHHAHLLLTTRRLDAQGFTEKTRELDDAKTGEVIYWRERWATLVNEHLAERGQAARIDHRSFEAQGITERDPTHHQGPAITAIERRGERAKVTERWTEEANERLALAAELGRLEREAQDLSRSILDTTADLQAALAARDRAQPAHATLAGIRRDAQLRWLEHRSGQVRAADRAGATPKLDLSGNLSAAVATRDRATTVEPRHDDHRSDQSPVILTSRDLPATHTPKATPRDDHAL